jgi:phosphopantetheine adenylyltransferase
LFKIEALKLVKSFKLDLTTVRVVKFGNKLFLIVDKWGDSVIVKSLRVYDLIDKSTNDVKLFISYDSKITLDKEILTILLLLDDVIYFIGASKVKAFKAGVYISNETSSGATRLID